MVMLKLKFLVLVIFTTVYCGYATFTIDAYSDPVLRVLLKTLPVGKSVVIYSESTLRVWGNPIREYNITGQKPPGNLNIRIESHKKNNLLINRKYVSEKNIFVYSESPLKFLGRSYEGSLKISKKGKKLYVINFVRLEKYLEGVINAEINSSWHPEAVKAQAVISRTFAMFRRNNRFNRQWDITDSEKDQVFKGIGISDSASKKAILATKGQHIRKNNNLIEAFFHSNSGGYTALAENIWNKKLDFVKTVKTPYGNTDPAFNWTYKIGKRTFARKLRNSGIKIKNLGSVTVNDRYQSQHAKNIVLQNGKSTLPLIVSSKTIRRILGYRNIKSLLFDIKSDKNNIIFNGRGHGHGVGLCQWCAKEMAEEGINYSQIIDYFYDDVKIKTYN